MSTPLRRRIVLGGSILALLLVLAMALPAVARIIQGTSTEQHQLPGELSSLTLQGQVGDITVRAAEPGQRPGAQATIRSSLTRPQVRTGVEGQQAALSDTCRDTWWATWWDNCSVDWSLSVPEGTTLAISSNVGDITISETSGAVEVTSDVGDISLSGVAAADVGAATDVGDITLDLAVPPERLSARSSTGDITITVPDDDSTYRVQTDTSLGEVRNQLGSTPEGTRLIDVRTSVGDIRLRRAG